MSTNIYNCICEQLTKQFINSFLNSVIIEGNILHIKYNTRSNIKYTTFEKYAFRNKKYIKFNKDKDIISMYFKLD